MAIDLRQVEPLGSKSVLLEQAMRRQKGMNTAKSSADDFMNGFDMSDMVAPDYEWLNEDKEAIQSLVQQMDASITMLANQVKVTENQAKKTKMSMEKEQQLMFKQIRTLNDLLKKQIDLFSSLESQMSDIEVKQSNLIPQVGVGLIAGLMSAVTILATAPWLTVLMESIR